MRRTVESAPAKTQILVWVRGAVLPDRHGDPAKGAWRLGNCWRGEGLPPKLFAEGYNGEWDIPYWMPMPDDPE